VAKRLIKAFPAEKGGMEKKAFIDVVVGQFLSQALFIAHFRPQSAGAAVGLAAG